MRRSIKNKMLKCIAVLFLFTSLVGCGAIKTYGKIISDPDVRDLEMYRVKDEIICVVILEEDARLESYDSKASQFKELVQRVFKDSTIIIRFEQNGIRSSDY